jgi:hypothetical protein
MIYHEIALEPESIEDLKDLGLLERMFGFEHGRLISEMPNKPVPWRELLRRHLCSLLPYEKRDEINLRLEKMSPKLIWRSRSCSKLDKAQEWFNLARLEHEKREFSCLIGKGERNHSHWVSFQKLYFLNDSLPECLSGPIHYSDAMKNPETFLGEIEPLLFSATRISFIDPYFNPVHPEKLKACRWRNTAEKLADYFHRSGRTTADIRFHTKYDSRPYVEHGMKVPSHEEFIQKIIDAIAGFFPPLTTIAITAWSERKNGIPFHARYLITDKAGIALDYGTDLGPKRRTDIALMPFKFAQRRLMDFECKDESPFHREATIQTHGRL